MSGNISFVFPDEIWLKVLSNLNVNDLDIVRRTNKNLYRLSHDDAIWKPIVLRTFGKEAELTCSDRSLTYLDRFHSSASYSREPVRSIFGTGVHHGAYSDDEYVISATTQEAFIYSHLKKELVATLPINFKGEISNCNFDITISRFNDRVYFKINDKKYISEYQLWDLKTQQLLLTETCGFHIQKFLYKNTIITYSMKDFSISIKNFDTQSFQIFKMELGKIYLRKSPIIGQYLILKDRLFNLDTSEDITFPQKQVLDIEKVTAKVLLLTFENSHQFLEVDSNEPDRSKWKCINLPGICDYVINIDFFNLWLPENKDAISISSSSIHSHADVNGQVTSKVMNDNIIPFGYGTFRKLVVKDGIGFIGTEYGAVMIIKLKDGNIIKKLLPPNTGQLYDLRVTKSQVIATSSKNGIVVWDFNSTEQKTQAQAEGCIIS